MTLVGSMSTLSIEVYYTLDIFEKGEPCFVVYPKEWIENFDLSCLEKSQDEKVMWKKKEISFYFCISVVYFLVCNEDNYHLSFSKPS